MSTNRKLMLEGFVIRPVLHSIDLDEATSEQISAGEQLVPVKEVEVFFAEQWPAMWASLRQQFDQRIADEVGTEVLIPDAVIATNGKLHGP